METENKGYYETIVREFFPEARLLSFGSTFRAYANRDPHGIRGENTRRETAAWKSLWRKLRDFHMVPSMEERKP